MQELGYDTLSDELSQALEDVEYEIATSSEKQLSVVQSMLNQMVGSYAEAYGKINSIISNTGFVGTTDFNDTVTNVGTSSGASSIAGSATQNQSTITPSGSASNIDSSNIKNNDHSSIETEIAKAPNTDNRPVAELKASPTSVTLEEGKSTSITTSIRPTDAKNKTLNWTSSDANIATVSNGTIKAVKPGSCKITVSTTDGSGISVSIGVTVTKKPEPPKPAPKPTTTSPQGDGVPNVGDKVTFVSGRYYYDSYGRTPTGNQMLGQSVYITKINSRGSKPYHISRTSRLGERDLGWLTLGQISGYYTGARRIGRKQLAFTDDTKDGKADLGSEVIVTSRGILRQLDAGDTVFNNEQVQRLWDVSNGDFDWSKHLMFDMGNTFGQVPEIINRNDMKQNVTASFEFENLLTINGNPREDIVSELRSALPQLGKDLTTIVEKGLCRDAIKGGFKRRF